MSILHMQKQTTLKDFVEGLNSFVVKPDDIISIFQALEKVVVLLVKLNLFKNRHYLTHTKQQIYLVL